MNWVLQLNNSQSVNSFNSLVEKFNMERSPNQPNQNPNQSVIDRGNLRTQKICLLLRVNRPVPTRSVKKVCTNNLVLQDRSGKPDNLSENIRVQHAHDGTGQPVERNSSSAHTVKEQFAPEEIVTLRHLTRTTSSTVQSKRRTLTSKFQDYHILQ